MNKFSIKLGQIILPLIFAINAWAESTTHIGAEYRTDEIDFTMAWDAGDGDAPDGYEIKLVMIDKVPPTAYALARTTKTRVTIVRPRAGLFAGYVRAYRDGLRCIEPTAAQNCAAEPVACTMGAIWDRCEDPAYVPAGFEIARLYSGWTISTDPQRATVDGQPMGWWIYWKVPPPSF